MPGSGRIRTAVPEGAPSGPGAPAQPGRIVGVDVARGVALLGMMAAHSADIFDDQGAPTTATVVTAGRSAATFVVIAGVSLAFMSGGRRVVQGPERTAVAAGLVVRAVLIGVIGLVLGMLADLHGVDGILPFYALLFLLAIPLVGFPPLLLAGVAAAVALAGPVLLLAIADTPLAERGPDGDPSLAGLLGDPVGLLVQLLFTGEYPVVVYMAYICAGLAIGRLDLGSRRLAWWLLCGGAALGVAARLVSALLLHPLGGLAALVAAAPGGDAPAETVSRLLWDPADPVASWWYLAVPAPHSHSTVDLLHTLGSACAVLGAALLLTRVRVPARALSPIAAAGAMVLTLYSAHLVFLATGVLEEQPGLLFLVMVVSALVFAVVWRRWVGQGPLEWIVAVAAGAARRRVAHRLVPVSADGVATDARREAPIQRGAARPLQFVVPVVCAAALIFAYWAVLGPRPENPAVVDGNGRAPSEVAAPQPAGPPAPPAAGGVTAAPADGRPDPDRYCQLSEQVGDLEDRFPEDPHAFIGAAEVQLADMARVAPVEIRDAVRISVDDLRAEADVPGAQEPEDAVLEQAKDAVDTYEEQRCP